MSDLTPTQQRAIAALISLRTNGEAAQQAGISERQLYRWLRDDAFRAHLQQAEAQLIRDVTRRFSSLLESAIVELDVLLHTHNLSAGEKIKVVRTVLELYPRMREVASFESRLEALEEAVDNDT